MQVLILYVCRNLKWYAKELIYSVTDVDSGVKVFNIFIYVDLYKANKLNVII